MKALLPAGIAALALAPALAFTTPAQAALVGTSLTCSFTDITPTATACSGWFDGNLLNNSGTHVQDQIDGLQLIGFTWDGDWSAVDVAGIKVDASDEDSDGKADEFDFTPTLNGISYIGIHKGKGGQTGVEGTAFFKIESDNVDFIKLNLKGASSAVLYSTDDGGGPHDVVPEPATWALMIMGFGGAGAVIRRRRGAIA